MNIREAQPQKLISDFLINNQYPPLNKTECPRPPQGGYKTGPGVVHGGFLVVNEEHMKFNSETKEYLKMRRGHGDYYNAHLIRQQNESGVIVVLAIAICAVIVLIGVMR